MSARIAPATAPFPPEIQGVFDQVMKGQPPLRLFTTLARDERLFKRFFGSSLLDAGHLSLREREIVIDRTTALCGSAYEWGVHVAMFGEAAGLSAAQIQATACGTAEDACWSGRERVLIRLCDALHHTSRIDDGLWKELRAQFSEVAILELLMLAGFYHMVSYVTNGLRLEPEAFGAPFPGAPGAGLRDASGEGRAA